MGAERGRLCPASRRHFRGVKAGQLWRIGCGAMSLASGWRFLKAPAEFGAHWGHEPSGVVAAQTAESAVSRVAIPRASAIRDRPRLAHAADWQSSETAGWATCATIERFMESPTPKLARIGTMNRRVWSAARPHLRVRRSNLRASRPRSDGSVHGKRSRTLIIFRRLVMRSGLGGCEQHGSRLSGRCETKGPPAR